MGVYFSQLWEEYFVLGYGKVDVWSRYGVNFYCVEDGNGNSDCYNLFVCREYYCCCIFGYLGCLCNCFYWKEQYVVDIDQYIGQCDNQCVQYYCLGYGMLWFYGFFCQIRGMVLVVKRLENVNQCQKGSRKDVIRQIMGSERIECDLLCIIKLKVQFNQFGNSQQFQFGEDI